MIILDSDVLIEITNKRSKRRKEALTKIKSTNDDNIVISSLVFEEVMFGILKKYDLEVIATHEINNLPVIDFTKEDALIASAIEIEMEKIGKKKPRMDVLIASQAIRAKAKLFTFNKKHYSGIPDLELL